MAHCDYGNHETTEHTHRNQMYVYTDLANGIPEDTYTCRSCYKAHILKYYPNGSVAAHFRKQAEQAATQARMAV